MRPNSTYYANSQRIRILMMSVISGHDCSSFSRTLGLDIRVDVSSKHNSNVELREQKNNLISTTKFNKAKQSFRSFE